MANLYNPRVGGQVQQVALPPVNDSFFQDFTLEPQMVRVRSPNTAFFYASSKNVHNEGVAPVNVSVSVPGDGMITRKVKRMTLGFVDMQFSTPVIN